MFCIILYYYEFYLNLFLIFGIIWKYLEFYDIFEDVLYYFVLLWILFGFILYLFGFFGIILNFTIFLKMFCIYFDFLGIFGNIF